MKKHFVHFYSPGTFMAEESVKPIGSWDESKAMKMARTIKERYGATPYGFVFSTRERGANDLDSKEVKRSGMHYLARMVKVETLEEIEKRNDPNESILRSNMRINGWDRVVTTVKGWKWTQPLQKNDKIVGRPSR